MIKQSLFIILVISAATIYPATSMSRWFSATYHDLRFTLHRYGHCINELTPIRDYSLNETDYLIHQIRVFLDQGNYDNEQLANITALMDNICRSDIDTSYPISVHIDVNKYNGTAGKENRCRAIDEAMDSMYYVFKRAALNKSEPLDFSVIQFHPNATDKSAAYNLTDLINTSWIKSETILEHVCRITDSIKEYVQLRASSSVAQKRFERTGVVSSLIEFLDRLLDPILGLQNRLYWESSNRFEQIQTRISSGLGSLRDGIGSRVKSTRDRVSNLFSSNSTTTRSTLNSSLLVNSSTSPLPIQTTLAPKAVNQTVLSNSSSNSNGNNKLANTTNSPL